MDVFEAFYLGSLLSGVRTLVGSVGLGGAAGTAWKQLVMPIGEAVVNRARVLGGGSDTGARMTDVYHNALSVIDTTFRSAKTWFGTDEGKTLTQAIHTGFSEAREGADLALGTMKKKQLQEEFQAMATRFDQDGAYGKRTIMQLARTMVAPVMAVQNIGTRGIVNIDNFYKGINLSLIHI